MTLSADGNLAHILQGFGGDPQRAEDLAVKGGDKVFHCGGGIVYHRHDGKELNWETGGVRSGAGVRSPGVSQESSGSSETWETAFSLLRLSR